LETLMIHDLKREYFGLPLGDYRLTFDDGLFSQYYYQPLLADQPGGLTFFVATALVRPGSARPRFAGRHLEHLKSGAYSQRAFVEKRLDDFMTVDEVRFLADQPGVRIEAHSHSHDVILTDVHPRKPKAPSPWKTERFREVPEALRRGLSIRSRLAFQGFDYRDGGLSPRSEARWRDYIREDTERCLEWFRRHLGRVPEAYCFPFNEYSPPLLEILRSYGFREFFASRAPRDPSLIPRLDIERLLEEGAVPAGSLG
jgi:hypothetical protein